jgi:hypothetical protein
VKEDKAISPPAAQCEPRSEHNAAIPAQQDGKAVAAERGIHGTGNLARDLCNPLRIEDCGPRVAHVAIGRHVDTHDIRGAEAFVEACPPKRIRSIFQPARTKPERRRDPNDQRIHRLFPNLRPRNQRPHA